MELKWIFSNCFDFHCFFSLVSLLVGYFFGFFFGYFKIYEKSHSKKSTNLDFNLHNLNTSVGQRRSLNNKQWHFLHVIRFYDAHARVYAMVVYSFLYIEFTVCTRNVRSFIEFQSLSELSCWCILRGKKYCFEIINHCSWTPCKPWAMKISSHHSIMTAAVRNSKQK